MNQLSNELLKIADNEFMQKYIEICKFYKEKPCKIGKYQFHHFYPVFLYRVGVNAKNRNKIIDEFDKLYDPKDNIIQLPPKWHLITHYFLGMALKTKEAINSFQIFLKDWDTPIEEYTLDKVKWFGQEYENLCLPNKQKTYRNQ